MRLLFGNDAGSSQPQPSPVASWFTSKSTKKVLCFCSFVMLDGIFHVTNDGLAPLLVSFLFFDRLMQLYNIKSTVPLYIGCVT